MTSQQCKMWKHRNARGRFRLQAQTLIWAGFLDIGISAAYAEVGAFKQQDEPSLSGYHGL